MYIKIGASFSGPILSEDMENRHQRDSNWQPKELNSAAIPLHYLGFIQIARPSSSWPGRPTRPGRQIPYRRGNIALLLQYFHTRDEKIEDKYFL